MQHQRQTTPLEWSGVGLSLLLLVVGIAEITGAVQFAPVPAYIGTLVVLSGLLWWSRRRTA